MEQSQSMQQNAMHELNDYYGKVKDLESKFGNKSAEVSLSSVYLLFIYYFIICYLLIFFYYFFLKKGWVFASTS